MAKIDISCAEGSNVFFYEMQKEIAVKLSNFSKNHPLTSRFIGVPSGHIFLTVDAIRRVSDIGETAIKGLANIFGAPFSGKCVFSRGVKQLFLETPRKIIFHAILFPFTSALHLIYTPIDGFISPVEVYERFADSFAKEKRESDRRRPLVYNYC